MPFTNQQIEDFACECEDAEIGACDVETALKVLRLIQSVSAAAGAVTRLQIKFLGAAHECIGDREQLAAAFGG